MGTWGTAIFSDDLAADVRDDYKQLLSDGKSPEEATQILLNNYASELNDIDSGPILWLSLAAIQWKTGTLQDNVKQNALEILQTGKDLIRWQENPSALKKRKIVLQKLEEQLLSPQPKKRIIRKKKVPVQVGDVFEIPLGEGRKAYGQYVYFDKKKGPIIQIFDLICRDQEKVDLDQLKNTKLLFSPVFIVGLYPLFRSGQWRVIGHLPIEKFIFPGFVSTLWDPKTGEATTWYLWDGEKTIRLGKILPDEYKKLEFKVYWPPKYIVDRIKTGIKPYEKLIMTNKL